MKKRAFATLCFAALLLAACSSAPSGGGGSSAGGGRSTSDARVRSFLGGPLPVAAGGGQWLRPMPGSEAGGQPPKVIYYQFAFPS